MASRVFDAHEKGHPVELAEWLPQVVLQLRRREWEERSRAYQYPSLITHFGEQQ